MLEAYKRNFHIDDLTITGSAINVLSIIKCKHIFQINEKFYYFHFVFTKFVM